MLNRLIRGGTKAHLLPLQSSEPAREATMGFLEISVVLVCATAFGFYIVDDNP